jgi:superfamily II RNA helicase
LDVLKKGVAFHHSGLVPILKETVEIIFSKGFVKVLFATETFSVGLNMPTKTVVFLEFNKPDGDGSNRMLLTDEFLQMAGRAGRRGKDTRGYVIYCPMRHPESEDKIKTMMCGRKSPLESKMEFGFQFILKSLNSNIYKWSDIVTNSFWYLEQLQYKDSLTEKLANLKTSISNITFSDREIQILEQRHTLETSLKLAKDIVSKKDIQRKIEQWKNTNIGKRWEDLYSKYGEKLRLESDLEYYTQELGEFGNLNKFLENYANFLEKIGYLQNLPEDLTTLTNENLTPMGVASTEINEGHCILSMDLYNYISKNIENYNNVDILKYLSLFISDDRVQGTTMATDTIKYINGRSTYYSELADNMGLALEHTYWDINTTWFNIVEDWVNDDMKIGDIIGKYDIMEGNLTRGILKLVNLIEEWRNVATYFNNVEMLDLLHQLENLVVKNVVSQDSLYIRV